MPLISASTSLFFLMLPYIVGFGDAGRAGADPAVKHGSWGYHPIPVTTMIGMCEANAKDMGKACARSRSSCLFC